MIIGGILTTIGGILKIGGISEDWRNIDGWWRYHLEREKSSGESIRTGLDRHKRTVYKIRAF